METQEWAVADLDAVLRAQEGDALQLGADWFPVRRIDLANVEKIVLEHAAAEQAEPRQGGPGFGAEVAAGEL